MALTVIEPHQILDATYSLEAVEIRLLQLAFANIYMQEGVLEDKLYEVDVKQYAKEFGLTHHAAYQALVTASKSLATKIVVLKSSLVDKNASKTAKDIIPWVHKIRYDVEDGSIKMQWHRDLIPLFNGLGKDNLYSKYLLENTSKMKSIHSIRLFRLLNKWKKQGSITWKLKEFKRLMGIEEDSYTDVRSLRRDVIDKAVGDINRLTDLQVKWEVVKDGRKIVGFWFGFVGDCDEGSLPWLLTTVTCNTT
jgi:plasmid replication initiation protein